MFFKKKEARMDNEEKRFDFLTKDGRLCNKCVYYYETIKTYAISLNLKNTIKSEDLACELFQGKYRDGSGGAPYSIHFLNITRWLLLLNLRNAIYDMILESVNDADLANEITNHELDIELSVALLHDVLEDCLDKLPNKDPKSLVEVYGLDPDILKYVMILTKNKEDPEYSDDKYYAEINKYWQTKLVKAMDRTDNCSTIDAFSNKRKEKYVKETHQYYYAMCSSGRNEYPSFSRIFTVLKSLIVSVCETVAAALDLKGIITPPDYKKTFYYLKGFSTKGGEMPNTFKALPLAKEYYKGYSRKSGDPFITHPLRVASYLISVKIEDDIIIAAALLHEIINVCHLEYNGLEIVTDYHLDPAVHEMIRIMSNVDNLPIHKFYRYLMQCPDVFILHLANKAHTCTKLMYSSDEEVKSYVEICDNYIFPTAKVVSKNYPQYKQPIEIMSYHLSSIINIAKNLRLKS